MIEPQEEKCEEPVTVVTSVEKIKKTRTPAQLETLRLAREKATVIRAQNAEMRRKQALVDKAAADEVKRAKVEKLELEYSACSEKMGDIDKTDNIPEHVAEKVVTKKKKRVIVVEESSSEDEIEVRLPKPKRRGSEIASEVTQQSDIRQQRYNKLYQKMFAIE